MDKVCKALVFGGLVEVTAFDTTELVRKCATIHNTSPVATVALGKVLSIASFMSNSLKNKGDRFSITIESEGPIGNIVVASNSGKFGNYSCAMRILCTRRHLKTPQYHQNRKAET